MDQLPAIIGAIGLLIGTVFGGLATLQNRANQLDAKSAKRLEQYERWRPAVRALVADLRDLLAAHKVPEPDGVDDVLRFPPPDQEKVKADDNAG